MVSHRSSVISKIIHESKRILEEKSTHFEDLIVKYLVKEKTPEWDIVCFLVSEKYSNKKKITEKWFSFWEKYSRERFYKNLKYIAPYSYIYLKGNKDFVSLVIQILELSRKEVIRITWDLYLPIFFDFRVKIYPKLTNNEYMIFQTVLDNQTLGAKKLARVLSMDQSNISKNKNQLIDKAIIFEGIHLNYEKLNLNIYTLIIEMSSEKIANILQDFPHSPFIYAIHTSHISANIAFVYYITPNYYGVYNDLLKLVSFLKKKYTATFSKILKYNNITRLRSFNYSNYNHRKCNWELPIYRVRIALKDKDIFNSFTPRILKQDFHRTSTYKLNLNKNGISILNHLIRTNYYSIRTLQKELKLPERTIRKELMNLETNKLFSKRISPTYIFGLINIVLLFKKKDKEQKEMHRQLSILPEVYSEEYETNEEKGYCFIIRVPRNIAFNILDVISEEFSEEISKMYLINQMYTKRWSLPEQKYETVFQEWLYDPTDLLGGIQ